MRERPKRDAEGEGVVSRPAVGGHVAARDRMDVGRVGTQRDSVGKHRASPLLGGTGEISKLQHEPVEPNRPSRVADVGKFGEAMPRSQHRAAEGDARRIDACRSLLPKPLVPGKGPVLGAAKSIEVDASPPVGPLSRGLLSGQKEIGEGIVVASLAILGRVSPVLQANITSRRLRVSTADPAIRPDLGPGVGLVAVGAVADFLRRHGPIGLVDRLGMQFLSKTIHRRLPAAVAAFERPVGILDALQVGMAGERQHLAPLCGVDEYGCLLGMGMILEAECFLGEPGRVGGGIPIGQILRRQQVVAPIGHRRPRRSRDAGHRHDASAVGRQFHLLDHSVEKHHQPLACRCLKRLELPLHKRIRAEAEPAHPAVARIFEQFHQCQEARRDVRRRAGHGGHAVGLGGRVFRSDRVPGLVHGRNTAGCELAADPVGGLDQGRAGPTIRRRQGRCKSGRAAAGDDHIEVVVHLGNGRFPGKNDRKRGAQQRHQKGPTTEGPQRAKTRSCGRLGVHVHDFFRAGLVGAAASNGRLWSA